MKITVDQVRNDFVALESYDYRERLAKAWWHYDGDNKVWRADSFRKVIPFLAYIDGAARRKFCADSGPPDQARVVWARRDIKAMAAQSSDDCRYRNSRGFSAANNGPGKRLAGKDNWDMVDYLRAERILRDHKGQVDGMREARNAAIQKNIVRKHARENTDPRFPPSPAGAGQERAGTRGPAAEPQPSLPGITAAAPRNLTDPAAGAIAPSSEPARLTGAPPSGFPTGRQGRRRPWGSS
jgi:hypothetical protein